jgi:hypothetical protein
MILFYELRLLELTKMMCKVCQAITFIFCSYTTQRLPKNPIKSFKEN